MKDLLDVKVENEKFNKEEYSIENAYLDNYKYKKNLFFKKILANFSEKKQAQLDSIKSYEDYQEVKDNLSQLPIGIKNELKYKSLNTKIYILNNNKLIETKENQILLSDSAYKIIFSYQQLLNNIKVLNANKDLKQNKEAKLLNMALEETKNNYEREKLNSSVPYNTYLLNEFCKKLNLQSATELKFDKTQKEFIKKSYALSYDLNADTIVTYPSKDFDL